MPDEHPHLAPRINLTASQVAALRVATTVTYNRLVAALIKVGKFAQQGFAHGGLPPSQRAAVADNMLPAARGITLEQAQVRARAAAAAAAAAAAECKAFMRPRCAPAFQQAALKMQAGPQDRRGHSNVTNQSVAAFLIIRPPVAFFGFGYESDDRHWHNIFLLQPGTPTDLCQEQPPGVFSRQWTNGKATLDCNTGEASLPFPSLVPGAAAVVAQ